MKISKSKSCRQIGIETDRELFLNRGVRIRTGRFKNLLSTTAVFTLHKRAARTGATA